MAELHLPDARWRVSFLEAMTELVAEGRAVPGMLGEDLLEHGPTWSSPAGFAAYVATVRAEAAAPRDPSFVPHTTWWWVEGRGHATAMLGAVLPHARALGIEEALVTCAADNLASRRVIEANGGWLENRRGDRLRYRVRTEGQA